MIQFCHISPTAYLERYCSYRPFHLTLAHLIEQDQSYTDFYVKEKARSDCSIIMDNSAFEMYKQGREMYPPENLIEMGNKIGADYIVMSDYPGEPAQTTIDAAKVLAPQLKAAGFGTFFVPQSREGDLHDYIDAFEWAAQNPDIIDYIGVSILGAPLAFGVERDNKLQRFMSRWKIMSILDDNGILDLIKSNGQKIHFLGMVDGPNEIDLVAEYHRYIDTWDSSAAVWLGLNGGEFDSSPTGLVDGKFEKEVDFDLPLSDNEELDDCVFYNIEYIDTLCEGFVYGY